MNEVIATCERCGGQDLSRTITQSYNIALKKWEYSHTMREYCLTCKSETVLVNRYPSSTVESIEISKEHAKDIASFLASSISKNAYSNCISGSGYASRLIAMLETKINKS